MTLIDTVECTSCEHTGNPEEEFFDELGRCDACEVSCPACETAIDCADAEVVTNSGYQDWCSDCVRFDSSACLQCGIRYAHDLDDVGYCEDCESTFCDYDCADNHNRDCAYANRSIHDYGYRPEPLFHGRGPRYMGVELEIDGAGEDDDNAEQILEHSNGEELFYIKHDSSLDSGMEIVSHPATLAYHLEKFPWSAITREALDLGYKSHDAGTCGLHVHVSRDALGGSHKAQELTISKLIILLWRHWTKIWQFSRRRDSDEHWCKQQYSDYKVTRRGLDNAKHEGRYTALNVTNYATIEFRLFRGTLNMTTLHATLQFVDVLVELATTHGISWVTRSSWADIVEACKAYPQLVEYLDTRGLGR